jgi:hypothetical protein
MRTIQSIEAHDHGAYIVICEGSSYIWNIDLPNVQVMYFYVGGFCKSVGECKLVAHVLKFYNLKNISRIFKLSGRYILNASFHIDLHSTAKNKIVAKIYPSTTRTQNIMVTVLYSFDTTLKTYMIEALEKAEQLILHNGLDIEHALCTILNESYIYRTQLLGVQGLIGPNGAYWES